MQASDSMGTQLSSWNKVQKQWWDGWFSLVSGAAVSSGMQTSNLWQSSMDVWQRSVDLSLQAQQDAARLWLGQAEDAASWTEELQEQSGALAAQEPVKLELGATASVTKQVTEMDIVAFAQLSGDVNPVHLNDAYAAQTRFKKRIAHGMLSAGLVSAVLGTKLPGPGTVYLSQNLKFRAPVQVGDEVKATATVVAQKEGKPIYTLETICTNQDGVVVLEGEAVILYEPVS